MRGKQTLNISENTVFYSRNENNLQRTMKFNIKFLDEYITKFNAYIPSYVRWRGRVSEYICTLQQYCIHTLLAQVKQTPLGYYQLNRGILRTYCISSLA